MSFAVEMALFVAVLSVCLLLPSCGNLPLVNAQDSRAGIPAHEDPGHNSHQEGVIFGCLGLIVVLSVLCTVILWFLVERTRFEIRRLDTIIPEIAERMRKETVTANGELMSGTLTASHEFETEFINNEEVQLTSYSRRNEAEPATEASAPAEEPVNENLYAQPHADRRATRREDIESGDHANSARRNHRHERYDRHARHERNSNSHERNSNSHERTSNSHERTSNSHERTTNPHERNSTPHERYSRHGRDSTPHERLDAILRANHEHGSRPPPPPYLSGYDNPGMLMNDERDYRRARREGPSPAPKPAKRSSRPVSAYLTSGNEYPDESRRPVSVIGMLGDEDDRRPRRHGHGRERKYKSLLYESHV